MELLVWCACSVSGAEAELVDIEWREAVNWADIPHLRHEFWSVSVVSSLNAHGAALGRISCPRRICRAFKTLYSHSQRSNTDALFVGSPRPAARMPRDNKTPLIQKIAKKAYVAFKGYKSAANGGKNADKQTELISLVTEIRAADLKITPRKSKTSSEAAELQSPPVSYMHICETEAFSMGVFLLKSGASIPLHDHPGMNGMLKVLYGKVSVCCYDKLDDDLPVSTVPPRFEPPLAPFQMASLRPTVLRSVAEYSENSAPCLLTPVRDNLHRINAVEGPAAFLDILAPPYNPDDGRDCHYYRVLETVEEGRTAEHQGEEEEKEEVTWLLEIPQPEDFWCGPEPYPGPVVSV